MSFDIDELQAEIDDANSLTEADLRRDTRYFVRQMLATVIIAAAVMTLWVALILHFIQEF